MKILNPNLLETLASKYTTKAAPNNPMNTPTICPDISLGVILFPNTY